MLSILIPTYNCDCTRLVKELYSQAEHADVDYEIIVADDASPMVECKAKNREINALPHCRLIELEENIGRARIRNRLADEARHEWLLFMDADAEVISDDFIDQYLKHTDTDADVICGGLCHADTLPSPEVSLRYAYEKRADKKRAAHYRAKKPYEQFTPFNFMIRRTTFQSIRFDESIKEYGHEDTLFGIELQRRQVSILHINNALCHTGIESNKVFLEKTRASLRNLATMGNIMQGHSALLKLYDLLSKMRLNGIVYRWFRRRESSITRHLLSTKPRLYLFFLYKLGYFVKLKSERA